MKRIFFIVLGLCFIQLANAQTAEEALRYADQNFYGTARSSAMGGAFSSLGGDITVASTNPAGLAIFRSSTASITPGIRFGSSGGVGVSGEKNNFILPSIGFVFATANEDSNWKNWSFAITCHQAANFNMNKNITDMGSSYSFLDDIAYEANNPSPYHPDALKNYKGALLPSLAYNTYLISPIENGEYRSALIANDRMNRFSNIEQEGSNAEVTFSAAGNYDNVLYFGGTIGIQTIDCENRDNYKEELANPTNESLLDRFYYDKYLHTRGTGINVKLGLIYRPTDNIRLGIAAHTPSFFSLEDEYLYVMESAFFEAPEEGVGKNFKQVYPLDNKTGIYEYDYSTPWKLTFGGSYIFGKLGLLSIDYDLIDYASAKFYNGDFDDVNRQIDDLYEMTGNLKIGTEIRMGQQFALRAGYNYFGNMYSNKSGMEQKAMQYSVGLGYSYKNITIDTSYQHYTQELTTHFKDFSSSQDNNANTIKLTFGYRF